MIKRSTPALQSLPSGPWSAEQMFETIRIVTTLRGNRSITRSWASQVLAEQVQRVGSAQSAGQISAANANRYIATLIRELERQQSSLPKMLSRNSPLIFRDMKFDNLLLRELKLHDTYFSVCSFNGSDLASSRFVRCNFNDCSFDQVDLRNSEFAKCKLST